MGSGWQKKLARVVQMNWDEFRTRLAQETYKRQDLLRYRLGQPPHYPRFTERPSVPRSFFFHSDDLAERIKLLQVYLPSEAKDILGQADNICQHRFDLLGYRNLDYGVDINWHLDAVHNKRAPLEPWFQIPFLEFAVVGDHKVTWELNRHQHLVTLAKAWLFSQDEKYLRELRAQWTSWIKANPYPLGINWGSSLEVAFRSLSWVWIDHLLAGAPGQTEFRTRLLPELAFHGRYIERFLSTYFSPNTHLLGEVVALFFVGTLYPEMVGAPRWQQTAWNILLQESRRQVRPDGVYFEQALHYHVYALDFFLHARLLAARNDLPVPADFDAILNRMLDVIQALSQAGPPEGFGDDDGGRLFDPRRNRTEHMADPLAIGAVFYARNELTAARLTEESIWLFGRPAVAALSEAKISADLHSAAFPDGGLYVLADSHPYPFEAVVDAGPQGVGRSGHGHADALSLRLTIDGERCLVDAGTGLYISSDPSDRNAFRGTAAHNTLRVDGIDQAIPADPFSWNAIPNARVAQWKTGETFTYFEGSHDGYARLPDPVIHSRAVVKIHDGPCLVRDMALGKREHDLEVFWHLAPGLHPQQFGNRMQISKPENDESPSTAAIRAYPSLELIVPEETAWTFDTARGSISPMYGAFQPAPLIRAHARLALPTELATVLTPRGAGFSQEEHPRLVSVRHAAVQVYELAEGNANHGFCFALDKRPWNFGAWFSDAEFLYSRIEGEHLTQLIVLGGSHVSWQSQPLLKIADLSGFFEWRKRDGGFKRQSERFTLMPLFHELTGNASSIQRSNATSYAEQR